MKTYRFFKILICLSLFLIFLNSITQAKNVQISGKVFDVVTKQELSDATIYITNLTSQITDSTFTNSSGYWEYIFPTSSVDNGKTLPTQFRVSQNYPNPFNPSTKINFFIPLNGEVKVTVYNTLGKTIDSHIEYLESGSYSIEWSAKGSAGVYFLNLKTKSGSATIKMIQLDCGLGYGLSHFRLHSNDYQNNQLSKISTTIPIQITVSKFGYLAHEIEAEVEDGEYFEISIETIHSHSTLVDLHNDILEKMIDDPNYHLSELHNYNHTDIPRLKIGGVDVQFFAVWVSPYSHGHDSYNHAMAMIDIFNTEMSLNSITIEQARTASEAVSIHSNNKIAAVLAVEGGHAIENDIQKLISLYEAGMRYLTITWNNSTDWAVSAQDSRSATVGLSEFGKQVIKTLDSLGVVIDISHTGIKTIEDILTITENPIVATHSGVRTLRDHYRNLYDSQIIDIANSGGVIGVVFYPPYLSNTGYANIASVANHIDYIVNLVGIDYVALGSDFDGIGTNVVQGLEDVTKFPDLTLELLRRDYSQSDIEKILGGNFMRVFEQVCGE